ncbi:PD-(D/E)XK nuclease family transposase [Lactobacillus taiwanensis]|uniref:PD-(D/E)XK nuclease family transposase n=1 Tax=Lactobacillus taiwanensis TaxID=508451 RepID=UPI0025A6100E|nr:PD-(D/E)XK nuclease family transposase [Lactobacillus taiwanensis]
MTKKKVVPWFGFTEDKVFGMVMENKDFCKYLLEIIIPDLKIKKIDWLDKQVEINNPKRKDNSKEVRLDVLVTDHEGRVFNIEMQTTDQDRSKQLHDGATKIIINSQKSAAGQSEDLQALAKLMNNEPVSLNKHFDYAQKRIKEINEDPEMREKIMLYETRMLEREQDAYKQEKIDTAKVILENQMDNGSTLEQATEFVRNLKIISDNDLSKIVDLYK